MKLAIIEPMGIFSSTQSVSFPGDWSPLPKHDQELARLHNAGWSLAFLCTPTGANSTKDLNTVFALHDRWRYFLNRVKTPLLGIFFWPFDSGTPDRDSPEVLLLKQIQRCFGQCAKQALISIRNNTRSQAVHLDIRHVLPIQQTDHDLQAQHLAQLVDTLVSL